MKKLYGPGDEDDEDECDGRGGEECLLRRWEL